MTQTQIKMATLYERLSKMGFPEKFVREKALPDWWDEEFEATPGSAIEAAAIVSSRLNLDIATLLKPDTPLAFKSSCHIKFKAPSSIGDQRLKIAQCMASRVAEMVAYTCIPKRQALPQSAQQVRAKILENYEFVNLKGLLEFCWDNGIPVVHFNQFPKGVHKFDGMVGYFYNHPVIVLSLNHRSPARLLFILAHELGHIIKDHVKESIIVDEAIKPENVDSEEIEASEFATELLLGKPDITYYTPRFFDGESLVAYARKNSARDKVDPGMVVLNSTWSKARTVPAKDQTIIWATASKALKILETEADAPIQINNYLHEYLDVERLDRDSQEYLELVTVG